MFWTRFFERRFGNAIDFDLGFVIARDERSNDEANENRTRFHRVNYFCGGMAIYTVKFQVCFGTNRVTNTTFRAILFDRCLTA